MSKNKIIILTNKARLSEKYGNSGFELILKQLRRLKKAHQAEGYDPKVFFIDNALGKEDYSNASAIRKMLFSKVEKSSIAHILIIGNDDIIPFFRVENLIPEGMDPDRIIYSDMLYSCQDHDKDDYFDFVPQISLGRLPDSSGDEPEFLLKQLKQAAQHRKIVVEEKGNTFFCYYAANFQDHVGPVLNPLNRPEPPLVSPPVDRHTVQVPTHPVQWFFILLHGSDKVKYWYGEYRDRREYPEAFSPEIIQGMSSLTKAVGFVLPCYGGYILQKDTKNSNALALLAQGTEALMASSVVVWAGVNIFSGEVFFGPKLAQIFFFNREKCNSIGRFFLNTKKKFIEDMANKAEMGGESYVNMALKTLMEFNLYADPSITVTFKK